MDLKKLKVGDSGPEINQLHTFLLKEGHIISEEEVKRKHFGPSTRQAVVEYEKRKVSGTVKIGKTPIEKTIETPIISKGGLHVGGIIHTNKGKALGGKKVAAYDRSLIKETLLGEAVSDKTGKYDISYSVQPIKLSGKENPDILIKVFENDLIKKEIGKSGIKYNAGSNEEINVIIDSAAIKQISEFERLTMEIAPYLEGIRITDLEESEKRQDFSFLKGKTGWEKDKIQNLRDAHIFNKQTNSDAEIFYGIKSQRSFESLEELSKFKEEAITEAFKKAVLENIVSNEIKFNAKDFLKTIRAKLVDNALKNISTGMEKNVSINTIASKVLSSDHLKHKAFFEAYFSRDVTIYELLNELTEIDAFKGTDAPDRLKQQMILKNFAGDDVNTYEFLNNLLAELGLNRNEAIYTVELAFIEDADLKKIIAKYFPDNNTLKKLPEAWIGTDPGNYVKIYFENIRKRLAIWFPTQVLAKKISDKATQFDIGERKNLFEFIKRNPAFDFRNKETHKANPDKKPMHNYGSMGVEAKKKCYHNLRIVQRLFNLTNDAETIVKLLDAKLHSAHSIAGMGYKRFEKKFGDKLGEQARPVYNAAKKTKLIATHVLYNIVHAGNEGTITLAPAGGRQSSIAGNGNISTIPGNNGTNFATTFFSTAANGSSGPEWRDLFGSLDVCDCEHCQSVFSPAAYLMDIIEWIRGGDAGPTDQGGDGVSEEDPTETDPVYQELKSRREDLLHLNLSCDNTNTALPYIDIVNEILENKIQKDKVDPNRPETSSAPFDADEKMVRWYQTTWTTPELRSHPEHINRAPYDNELKKAVYPYSLPFNLALEETRVYLNHLGVKLHEVMELFTPGTLEQNPVKDSIAYEILGLSPEEAKLVVNEDLQVGNDAVPLYKFYGSLDSTFTNIPNPASPSEYLNNDAWDQQLSNRVDVFLQQTGLSYVELLDLLECEFINPTNNNVYQIKIAQTLDPAEITQKLTCQLDKLKLEGLDQASLKRIHRFIRLWRKTGWSVYDLDRIIVLLGNKELNRDLLINLSVAKRTKDRVGLEWEEVLAFWSDINELNYRDNAMDNQPEIPSIFKRLFLNNAVPIKIDETKTILQNRDAIIAALDIDQADFEKLYSINVLTITRVNNQDILVDSVGNLKENLSRLYRHCILAKKMGFAVSDFVNLKDLLGITLFNSPADTWKFILKSDSVKASPFSLNELRYILGRHCPVLPEFVQPDSNKGILLAEIQKGLITIESGLQVPEKIDEELVSQYLLTAMNDEDLGEAISILNESTLNTPDSQRAFVQNKFFFFRDIEDAKSKLVGNTALPAGIERYKYVTSALLKRDNSNKFIVQKLSEYLKVESQIVSLLILAAETKDTSNTDALLKCVNPHRLNLDAIHDLLEMPNMNTGNGILLVSGFEDQFNSINRVEKIAIVINRLKFKCDDIKNISLTNLVDILKFSEIPFAEIENPDQFPAFNRFEVLLNLCKLRDTLPSTEVSVFDNLLLKAPVDETNEKKNSLIEKYQNLTQWSKTDIITLIGVSNDFNDRGHLDFSFPTDYKDGSLLLRLLKCFLLIKRLGATAQQCIEMTNVTALSSGDIAWGLAKSKHNYNEWPTIAKTLRDPLREKQRDVLTAYLIANPPVIPGTDPADPVQYKKYLKPNDLYADLLIDVEMSACMMTTRIRQAMNSVQHFIDRVLLNLEGNLHLEPEEVTQWKQWRKTYRIWEANRKIFLYPENWLEPELRDDKSPFFKELENELLQNDITDRTAEDAFLHYLEKLDVVATLEIVGMYYEEEEDNSIETITVPSFFEGPNLNLPINTIMPTSILRKNGVLHVFGRTYSSPHLYYYRNLNYKTRIWSAWEKINLDIEEDHIAPIVFNNQLNLFWPKFEQKSIKDVNDSNKAFSYYDLKLFFSEYKNRKWTSKSLINDSFSPSDQTRSSYDKKELIVLHSKGTQIEIGIGLLDSGAPPDNYYETAISINANKFTESSNKTYSIKSPGDFKNNAMMIQWRSNVIRPFKLFSSANEQVVDTYQPILNIHNKRFAILYLHQFFSNRKISFQYPYFFQDVNNCFFVDYFQKEGTIDFSVQEYLGRPVVTPVIGKIEKNVFYDFSHKHINSLIQKLNQSGLDNLFQKSHWREFFIQDSIDFYDTYNPDDIVDKDYPKGVLKFNLSNKGTYIGDAYASYNWEFFFHAPFTVACSLFKNQRFEEARRWFHFIFDPTTGDVGNSERFWQFYPFYQFALNSGNNWSIETLFSDRDEILAQIDLWEENPFNPHAIARLRMPAYMMSVVMKYLDNLIAWGDQLFGRFTTESITEATQKYMLAADILGRRAEKIPQRAKHGDETVLSMLNMPTDAWRNAELEITEWITPNDGPSAFDGTIVMDYFCIPKNESLKRYWDTVVDRLFKIRHCMNIEGVVGQPPIFDPPIDPGMLVRAAAAGIDLSSILSELNAPLPFYRFNVLSQKATELCNEVKSLGNALLSALEKRDAEELALIRSSHEINVLESVKQVKEKQIDEAEANLKALEGSKKTIEIRRDYYERLLKGNSVKLPNVPGFEINSLSLNLPEALALGLNVLSTDIFIQGIYSDILGGVVGLLPEVSVGTNNSAETGGKQASAIFNLISRSLYQSSALMDKLAGISTSIGSYMRRVDEWKQQSDLAKSELKQIEKQIIASELRKDIAEKEFSNHEQQIENSKTVDEYMRNKFTNQELYQWMIGQISTVYFQSYQLAFDVAKKAEQSYRHELGLEDSNFIQFGYWDSLKKGLLSGEKLHYDIKRMEIAYMDNNIREHEVTKYISLAMLNGQALIDLRHTASCEFFIPELLFEMDFPKHYFRRIKSVSVSIPCIAGPYTSVSAELSLSSNYIRYTNNEGGKSYPDNTATSFRNGRTGITSIATSNAQNDSGMFELNFRDDRYLPFEGAGVISNWNLSLPAIKQFDYNSISDVIITIRYTARKSSNIDFGNAVTSKINGMANTLISTLNDGNGFYRLLSLKHDFPDEFYKLQRSTGEAEVNHEIDFNKSFFPYFTKNYNKLNFKSGQLYNKEGIKYMSGSATDPSNYLIKVGNDGGEITTDWKLKLNYYPNKVSTAEDILILINYTVSN